MKKGIDMIHGPIGPKTLAFAIPVALTGLLQQLFNAADVAVVGRFVGSEAMAAVGSNSPVIGLLVNLFVGVSLGANVVIANFTGRGDHKNVKKAVHTAMIFAPLAGIFVTLVGELLADPLLALLGVPDDVLSLSEDYLRIYLLGMPVILLYNFESAIFRSQGRSVVPLISLTIAGVVNVVLNLFFVIQLGMSADGVALATVISNALSSAIMFVLLLRSDTDIGLSRRYLHINRNILANMLRVGMPAGLQGMVFSISNLCIQSAINSLGSIVMAACSAAFEVEIFIYYIVNAFGQACTTFVSQNRGAGRYDRCRDVLRIVLIQNLAATLLAVAVFVLPGRYILQIFNTDPEVLDAALLRLRIVGGLEVFNTVLETFSSCLRGHEYSLFPALMTLVGVCGLRIVWVYSVFAAHPSLAVLMASYPVSWVVTAAGVIIYYLRKRREIYHLDELGTAACS